ncbi:MAG TPA: hypothetical protein VF521_04900 [Pyrinomonadaceae bacterium]
MSKLGSLAQLAIDAAGGLDRWRRFETVSARLACGGVIWPLKHQQGVLDDVRVRAGLRKEWASHRPFGAPDLRTSFQPHRVAIETAEGQTAEELLRPRDSFQGHSLETPWTRLQLAYFAGYAMWTYLNTPFLFASDGVETEEVEPWREGGETWRRLKVTFPPDIATHSTVQTFYFDAEGLLKRHDYEVEVSGGTTAAHYVYRHEEFSGILLPTRRRVLRREPDGTTVPEPLIVTIDLSEVEFS